MTEVDKYIDSIRVVRPSFRLRTGKRIVFADIQEIGRNQDGTKRLKVETMEGIVMHIFKTETFIAHNDGYEVELLDGSTKRIRRYQVIEVI